MRQLQLRNRTPLRPGGVLLALVLGGALSSGVLAHANQDGSGAPSTRPGADAPKPAGDLPSVDEVIARMVRAEGGAEAMQKVHSRKISGTLEIVGRGMTAESVSWNAGEGKYRETMNFEGLGKFEQGISGDIVWGNDPLQGARVLEGVEAEMIRRTAQLEALLNIRENYPQIRVVERTVVGEVPCFHLELKPKVGNAEHWFVGEQDGLVRRVETMVEAPMIGKIQLRMDFGDYREVDGLTLSHSITIEQGPQTMRMRVSSIEHNLEIPEGTFDLPKEVAALVAKKGGAKPEGAETPGGRPESRPKSGGSGGP